jgi:hypothetical protein
VKERLVTLGLALGALALFVLMFLRSDGGFDRTGAVPRPTSTERRESGHFAAAAWLRNEALRAVSWREGFGKLSDPQAVASPTGNLLIVTLPATVAFSLEEILPLQHWVRAGNTLLVLAALSDSPEWAQDPPALTAGDIRLLTGLELSPLRGLVAGGTLVPNRRHAYFEGVERASAAGTGGSSAWEMSVPYDGFALALAHDRQTGQNVLWARPLGKGQVIVSAYGSLFSNQAIGRADNARLLANLVATNVGARGAVLFDDVHQGLGAAYDPRKFYSDPRLYETVAILGLLWLLWVFGSARLRPAATSLAVPSETELTHASANLFARVLRPHAAARALIVHVLGEPPWHALERHPGVVRSDLDRLKTWYSRASAGKRVPLVRLQNLLVRIERQIA